MPQNQPKADIEAIEDPLIRAYANAWERIQLEQQAIATDPSRWRRRARLTEVQRRIEGYLDEVDLLSSNWIKSEFPQIYAMGASAGAAEMGVGEMVWTQIHQQAVQSLAQDLFNDLLKSTKLVRKQTKDLVRSIAKDEALQKAVEGKSATQAAKLMEQKLAQSGIKGMRYKNGAYHGIDEYSQMAIRTKTAVAYNTGTLNEQTAQGIVYWECFDGPTCGWTGHSDTNQALGKIVTRDEALAWPISHPNCRRAFGARPDVKTKAQAEKAKGSVTAEQTKAQKAQDAERKAAQDRRSRTKQKLASKPLTPSGKPTGASKARRDAVLEQRAAKQGDVDLSPPAPATDDMILKSFLEDPYKDVPTVDQLMQQGYDKDAAIKEHKRLKANAASKASKLRAKMKEAGNSLLDQDVADGKAFTAGGSGKKLTAADIKQVGPEGLINGKPYVGPNGEVIGWIKKYEKQYPITNSVGIAHGYTKQTMWKVTVKKADGTTMSVGETTKLSTSTQLLAQQHNKWAGSSLPSARPNPKIVHSSAAHSDGLGFVADTKRIDEIITTDTPNLIPVQDLKHHGVVIKNGLATRRNGRVYVMETPAGEAITDAMKAEFEQFIGDAQQALVDVPQDLKGIQKSVFFMRQNNPVDDFWAKKYGKPDFKSAATGGQGVTTLWNTKPWGGTLRHEWGHILDDHAKSIGGINSGSDAWTAAQKSDMMHGSKFHTTAKETFTGHHPMTPGQAGVTDYGAVASVEDWAESVRLYMKDRYDGKLAVNADGIELRFRDLFPERARILDKYFGVDTDKVPATKWQTVQAGKMGQDFEKDLDMHVEAWNEMAQDLGGKTYKNGADFLLTADKTELADMAELVSFIGDEYGISESLAQKALTSRLEKMQQLAKIDAASKKIPEPVVPKAPIPGAGTTPSVAQMKSELPANVKASIASKKSKTKKELMQGGMSEAEATAKVAQIEAEEVEKRWRALNGGTAQRAATQTTPVPSGDMAKMHPDFRESERKAAAAHLAGTGRSASQAKDAIMKAIAKRLDNPEDWDTFREFYDRSGKGRVAVSGYKPGHWGSVTNADKAKAFFDRMADVPLDKWSADDVMEFIGLDLQDVPVWTKAKAKYDAALAKYGNSKPDPSKGKTIKLGTKETKGAGKQVVGPQGQTLGWVQEVDVPATSYSKGYKQFVVKLGDTSSSAKLSGKFNSLDEAFQHIGLKTGTKYTDAGGFDPKLLLGGFNGVKFEVTELNTAQKMHKVFDPPTAKPAVAPKYSLPDFDKITAAERQRYLYDEVNARVGQWASNSGDSQAHAMWMQMAVKEEFGTTGDPFIAWSPSRAYGHTKEQVINEYSTYGPMYRRIAREMYNNTQEELIADGVEWVSVYRGMSFGNPPPTWAQYGHQRVQLQPINSYSTSRSMAVRFANGLAGNGGGSHRIVIEARVHRSRIIGSARTGFGCQSEYEFVLMDTDGLGNVTKA